MRRISRLHWSRTLLAATLASLLAALAASALPVAAAEPEAAVGAGAPEAAPPAAPAFHTVRITRLRVVEGDVLNFEGDDGKPVRLRLAFADCTAVADSLRGHADTVTRSRLEEGPVWVFPYGCGDGPLGREVYADVWTDKGWLSETLIRSGYARRRTPADLASLAPPESLTKPRASPPPPAPAFCGAAAVATSAEVLDIDRGGRTVRTRLYDVTCAGLDAAKQAEARTVVERLIGGGPVWVFPSNPRPPGAGEALAVRIWTSEGWLAHALLKRGLALPYADPDKPASQAVAQATPDPAPPAPDTPEKTPATPRPPRDPDKPGEKDVTWTPVAVTVAKRYTGGMQGGETAEFNVPYGVWRVAWDCRPERPKSIVVLNVYRVDDNYDTRVSSHHVTTLKGQTGATVVRGQPGKYWVKLSCSADVDKIKVDVAEPAAKP
jgi:endonuclease YncB( thermonuclease family)